MECRGLAALDGLRRRLVCCRIPHPGARRPGRARVHLAGTARSATRRSLCRRGAAAAAVVDRRRTGARRHRLVVPRSLSPKRKRGGSRNPRSRFELINMISLVIPVYNEEESLALLFEEIAA